MRVFIDEEITRSAGRIFDETTEETSSRLFRSLADLLKGKEFLKEYNEDTAFSTRSDCNNACRIAKAMKEVYVNQKATTLNFTAPHVLPMEGVIAKFNEGFGKFTFAILSSSTTVTKVSISPRT